MAVLVEMLDKWAAQERPFTWHRVAVAFSGGADSTALLLAATQLAKQQGATQLAAIHVHHGLQAAADDFEKHAESVCQSLSDTSFALPFFSQRVSISLEAGDSVEQRARESRYAALAQVAARENIRKVLLAHHADDQAESVLLALSRGAGLAGLAGMPAAFERHGMRFARPLLDAPGSTLKQAVRESHTPFIEDPTNADERYTRNRFRAQLMPAVEATMPAYRDTFARAARHAAQAQALLDNIAEQDLETVCSGMHISLEKMCAQLAPLRWPNVLRYWLKREYQVTPSTAQLDELCAQIATSQRNGAPRNLRLKVASGHVLRDKDLLSFEPSA